MNSGGHGTDPARLRVLVVATQQSALAARIAIALADAGFHVAALTPHGNPVRQARKVAKHFTWCRWLWSRRTVRALDRWSPNLIVCADDLAVRQLTRLHHRIVSANDARQSNIRELIELSLGPAASFSTICDKSDFLLRAASEGLRCPRTVVTPAGHPLVSVPADLNYPMVVKADHSYGGICVRIVDSAPAVRAAAWEVQTPSEWHGIFRRLFAAVLGSAIAAHLKLPLRRTISLQEYISGRPGNRAVVCWKGEVLAGISVEVIEVTDEHRPASVVRTIDHPEMASAVEHMVKCLNLSGFIGIDFILDASDQAWIVEMNPRVTPICHLSLADGTHLPASLYLRMSRGLCPPPKPGPFVSEVIALFPNEVIRSPDSEYLRRGRHDVPWDEPLVVRSVLDRALRVRLRDRTRAFIERYPAIDGALIRFGIRAAKSRARCGDGGDRRTMDRAGAAGRDGERL